MTKQDQLNSFMNSLFEKGFISKNQLYKSDDAVKKVLSVINLDDFLNGSVCFDDIKCKLNEKYIDYSIHSILSYATRFRALVKKYLKGLEDPEVFYEELNRTKQKIKESKNINRESVKFQIMVNGNSIGYFQLPSKLTADEALKIKEFIISATNCLIYE